MIVLRTFVVPLWMPEIPGSLVPEPKHRDSQGVGIVSESESSSKQVHSLNLTRNRVLEMDRTGIGFWDWTVSEPELESKKMEPGTSAGCKRRYL